MSSTASETTSMNETQPDIDVPSDQSDLPCKSPLAVGLGLIFSPQATDRLAFISLSSATPKKNGSSYKKDGTPRKPRRAPSASPTKAPTSTSTSIKQSIIGHPPAPNTSHKPSDADVVVALFERVISKGTPEDVAVIAEQFGVDKRLLRLVSRDRGQSACAYE